MKNPYHGQIQAILRRHRATIEIGRTFVALIAAEHARQGRDNAKAAAIGGRK